MSRRWLALVACVFSFLSILSWSAVAEAAAIGEVVAVSGAPSASGPAGDRKLSAGSAVFEDDKIVVRSGNAQIKLNDGTKLVVGPGSTLILDKYVSSGTGAAQNVSVKALRGTFRFITGRSKKGAYKITTANATIGIRGTGFDYWVNTRTGVAVLVGAVKLSGNSGGSVNLRADCEVGRAGGGSAIRLDGVAKSNNLKRNFPFIASQSSLNSQFRLPITNCRTSLFKGSDRESGESGGTLSEENEPKGNNDDQRSQ